MVLFHLIIISPVNVQKGIISNFVSNTTRSYVIWTKCECESLKQTYTWPCIYISKVEHRFRFNEPWLYKKRFAMPYSVWYITLVLLFVCVFFVLFLFLGGYVLELPMSGLIYVFEVLHVRREFEFDASWRRCTLFHFKLKYTRIK